MGPAPRAGAGFVLRLNSRARRRERGDRGRDAVPILQGLNRLGGNEFCNASLQSVRATLRLMLANPSCFPHFRSAYVVLVKGSDTPVDPTQLFFLNCCGHDNVPAERRFVSDAVTQQWSALRGAEAATAAPAARRDLPTAVRGGAGAAAAAAAHTPPPRAPSSSSGAATPNSGSSRTPSLSPHPPSSENGSAAADIGVGMDGLLDTPGDLDAIFDSSGSNHTSDVLTAVAGEAVEGETVDGGAVNGGAVNGRAGNSETVDGGEEAQVTAHNEAPQREPVWPVGVDGAALQHILSSDSWRQSLTNDGPVRRDSSRPHSIITQQMLQSFMMATGLCSLGAVTFGMCVDLWQLALETKRVLGAAVGDSARDWKNVCPKAVFDNNWATR